MFTSRKTSRRRLTISALSGAMLAIASTTALAAEYGGGDGEDAPPGKTEACAFIGCANGARVCGTASGKITGGAPPFVGEVAVSWTCYEQQFA